MFPGIPHSPEISHDIVSRFMEIRRDHRAPQDGEKNDLASLSIALDLIGRDTFIEDGDRGCLGLDSDPVDGRPIPGGAYPVEEGFVLLPLEDGIWNIVVVVTFERNRECETNSRVEGLPA